jgi:Iap family predicted aminopeptidase
MNRSLKFSLFILLTFLCLAQAETSQIWSDMIGAAFTSNRSYPILERLCDEAGGRLVGSEINRHAMDILKEELAKSNCPVIFENFTMPGWVRGDDRVTMESPTLRRLKAVALGFVEHAPVFSASVIYTGYGFEEDYQQIDARDHIVLVTSERAPGKRRFLRQEAIQIAADKGAKAIFFINDKDGNLNLAGTGDFQGNPTSIPAFSLTREEGLWLKRLIERSIFPVVNVEIKSYCTEIETANIISTLPGVKKEKIVIGAHFDSWDLGQGAIDNGLGTAILYEVASLIQQFSPQNYYTVEFVWFNGEELGLFGSKKYVDLNKNEPIIAMFNMDMTGSPTGFNAMGFDQFVPVFEALADSLKGFNLDKGVISRPWTNSDHMPFMLAGIPTLSLQAHLDDEMARYYHSAGDTFDKVNRKYLSEAAAVVSVVIQKLANDKAFKFPHKSEDQIIEMLKKFNLEEILKHEKEWPFGSK